MSRNDSTGAESAARYFLASYSYLLASGKVKDWDALSESGCVFCASARKTALELAKHHQHVIGGEIRVDSISMSETDPGYSYLVMTRITQAPLATADSNGDPVGEVGTSTKTPANLVLHWKNNDWLLRELDFAADPLG